MSEIQAGDRVKIEFEGEVTINYLTGRYEVRNLEGGFTSTIHGNHLTKIEPPVVQFGPGQLIRDKSNTRSVILLGTEHYTYVSEGSEYPYRPEYAHGNRALHTSENYDLVELPE